MCVSSTAYRANPYRFDFSLNEARMAMARRLRWMTIFQSIAVALSLCSSLDMFALTILTNWLNTIFSSRAIDPWFSVAHMRSLAWLHLCSSMWWSCFQFVSVKPESSCRYCSLLHTILFSMWVFAAQSTPSDATAQVDRLLREVNDAWLVFLILLYSQSYRTQATTFDGILEFRNAHFWSISSNKVRADYIFA